MVRVPITITSKSKKELQHLVPFALVFQHDLAEEANGRHAMVEQFVVKLL